MSFSEDIESETFTRFPNTMTNLFPTNSLLIANEGRGSGRLDGIVDDCPTDSTVKQEALSREQWIRWSRGLPIDDDIEIMPIEAQLLAIVHPVI